jgi:predicted nicotinamide N-methyase
MEIRVTQDGARDCSTSFDYRADESGGWIWEATHALEAAALDALGAPLYWTTAPRVLELGAGTGYLSLRLAQRGVSATATDREGALPRVLRNVLRNQARFGFTADGEQILQVECAALDWEADDAALPAALCSGAWQCVVGGDLIYLHEMHEPLLRTLRRHAGDAPILLSWEQRKPSEEARFVTLAQEHGFQITLVREAASSVSGAPIFVYRLQRVTPQEEEDAPAAPPPC